MHEIDMKRYNVRSDLVIDNLNNYELKDGVVSSNYNENGIIIDDIRLDSKNILNKKEGRYITISFDDVTDKDNRRNVSNVLIKYLDSMLTDLNLKNRSCLVVGLGNVKSTPDALGPKVIDKILVTRYLFNEKGIRVEDGFSCVSAIAPGVNGTTGIESSDIILGIVKRINPDFLIVIDALASSSLSRINKTIQITDTGIHPGSGVGNKRNEISLQTIKIPVIAIGIPTVIDGVTIVNDTINYMLKKFSFNLNTINDPKEKLAINRNYLDHEEDLSKDDKEKLLGILGTLDDDEKKALIYEVLSPINYNLMVTVKEIDFVLEKLVDVLSFSINKVLHEKYIDN